jgi:hypothetical protein
VWEEEVEDAGREEDLEVAEWEQSSDGGQEDSKEEEHEEEQHEEGAGLDDEGVGVMGLLLDPLPHTDLGSTTSFTLL